MTNGLVIAFDGPDGVGKTTQLEMTATELRNRGHEVVIIHLLSGTPIGEALRDVMFSDLSRPAGTNLHMALAIYHALAPELEAKRQAGTIVLLDRSPLSLIAFQVYGDGFDETTGYQACDEGLSVIHPEKVIVYSAPTDVLLTRRDSRNEPADYFEKKDPEYHTRTSAGYAAAAAHYQATLIEATNTAEIIHQQTMAAIAPLLS